MRPAQSVSQQPETSSPELPSYCKSLFSGVIAADLVFPFPELPADESENLAGYVDDLERFLDAKVDGAAFDRDAAIPEGVLEGLAERGVFGLYVSEEYGGMGFGQRQSNRVSARIAARDPGLAVLLGSHLSIGIKGIWMYGTEEQKRRWLPACARGQTLASFALTEPEHGSAAGRARDSILAASDPVSGSVSA